MTKITLFDYIYGFSCALNVLKSTAWVALCHFIKKGALKKHSTQTLEQADKLLEKESYANPGISSSRNTSRLTNRIQSRSPQKCPEKKDQCLHVSDMQSWCSGEGTHFPSRGVVPLDSMVVHCYRAHTMNRKVHSPLRRHLWPGGILAEKRRCGQIPQIQKVILVT